MSERETRAESAQESPATHANVDARVHRVADLHAAAGGADAYAGLTKRERAALSREVTPTRTAHTHNITTRDLHRLIVDALNPDKEVPSANAAVSHLAIGSEAVPTPSLDSDMLNNEEYRTELTQAESQGNNFFTSTFLDAGEANGVFVREIGLVVDATDRFVNHALVLEEEKTVNKTMTFDITLRFREVSEL